jgi:SAM-dependent methyltransferase
MMGQSAAGVLRRVVPPRVRGVIRAVEGRGRAAVVALDKPVVELPPASYRPLIRRLTRRHGSVLDLGCGPMTTLSELSVPVRVGVDAFAPYLERRPDGPLVPVLLDARSAGNIFPPQSFDLVTMFDFIEHLTREDALRLLETAERLARRRVLVVTPRGHFPQAADVTGLGGDEYQTHRSEWDVDDFTAMGYRVAIVQRMHGPGNASFDAAFPPGAPNVDGLVAWKDIRP